MWCTPNWMSPDSSMTTQTQNKNPFTLCEMMETWLLRSFRASTQLQSYTRSPVAPLDTFLDKWLLQINRAAVCAQHENDDDESGKTNREPILSPVRALIVSVSESTDDLIIYCYKLLFFAARSVLIWETRGIPFISSRPPKAEFAHKQRYTYNKL